MKNIFTLFLLLVSGYVLADDTNLLRLKNGRSECLINTASGAPVGFEGEWWSYKTTEGKRLGSDHFIKNGSVSHRVLADSLVAFDYSDAENKVTLTLSLGNEGLDCQITFTTIESDVCEVSLPASIDFNTEELKYVIFPNELGIKLKQEFYRKQSVSKLWKSKSVGTSVLADICGLSCVAEPNVNKTTKVALSPLMQQIASDDLAKSLNGSDRLVVRPATTKPKYNLITSDAGSFFGGHAVGNGVLLRFAGKLTVAESDVAIKTVQQTIDAFGRGQIEEYNANGRKKIGLLNIAGCPNSSGWSEVPVDAWHKKLVGSPDFVNITSVEDAMRHITSNEMLAIINPYGELLPIGDKEQQEVITTIKQYITNGGLWVETGGYPFFNTLEPSHYNTLETHYPFAFSDIFEINTQSGSICFYGIQDDTNFIPMQWKTWADADGGHISRSWKTYIYKNKAGQSPVVRFARKKDFRECVTNYAKANNFVKPLSEKMPLATLEKWKHSAIMKFLGRTINEQTAQIANLPSPSIVHIWDYVKGGFDKLYPEHLEPNQKKGTMDDFRNIIKESHLHGHLFMPYTNNTWWCDDPAPEILTRTGKSALLWDKNGNPVKEDYAGNYGWSLSTWHNEVIESGIKIAKEFSDLNCDIIFEDQSGAREWVGFDFNPASPSPASYHQGIINLSRDAAAYRPLATEQGYDRLINAQSEFCGLTWMLVPFKSRPWWVSWWLKSYSDLFDQATYEAYPIAQYVANGNTFFTHHLGGPLVETSENLGWTLALGYQIRIDRPTHREIPTERRHWIEYLAKVQNEIAYRYMGQPMRSFEYLAGSGNSGVIKTLFDDIEIVTNLSDEVFKYRKYIVAPKGFIAITKDRIAGFITEFNGKKFAEPRYIMYNRDNKTFKSYEF